MQCKVGRSQGAIPNVDTSKLSTEKGNVAEEAEHEDKESQMKGSDIIIIPDRLQFANKLFGNTHPPSHVHPSLGARVWDCK